MRYAKYLDSLQTALKPCPRCASENVHIMASLSSGDVIVAYGSCLKCGFTSTTEGSSARAAAAWNTEAQQKALL